MLIDSMNHNQRDQSQAAISMESIKRYETVIESLNKKIEYLELSAKNNGMDSRDLNWAVYHKFNKDLKSRLAFINQIMDWKQFASNVLENKNQFKPLNPQSSKWASLTSAVLKEEAFCRDHFTVTKSPLVEVMEEAYFPIINCQEHFQMYE